MVLDTSAIIAILFDEPEAEVFERQIADDPLRLLSAGSVLEAGIIIESRLGDAGGREFDLWLQRAAVEIVPIDLEQAETARRAWRRYGKGRHSASLNYGDCFSYALAVTRVHWRSRVTSHYSSRATTSQEPTSSAQPRKHNSW